MNTFEKASNEIEKDKYDGTDIENVIEWLRNSDKATLSFTQGRMITKIRKLAKENPEQCEIYADTGNSIVAHIPVKWIKISPTRKMSEEQRQAAGERMRKLHAKGDL